MTESILDGAMTAEEILRELALPMAVRVPDGDDISIGVVSA
ncbi:hypothetical protein PBI_REDNO2_135 [Mycobacterium phage Redno2]|nr:hypothetical protein N860_gp135 [Mycobacterium phage Redno2]AGS82434.1 hypothetical protein PBI_REDNO2_135 [Mycobacterium phage Redno2]